MRLSLLATHHSWMRFQLTRPCHHHPYLAFTPRGQDNLRVRLSSRPQVAFRVRSMRLQSCSRLWQCETSNLYLPPEQHAKLRALAGVTNVTVTFGQPSNLKNEHCPIGGVYSFFLDCRLPQQLFLGSDTLRFSASSIFGWSSDVVHRTKGIPRRVSKKKRCRTALL